MKNRFFDPIKQFFFSFFPYLLVFLSSLYFPSDSDLGWHLKYGEYFFQNGMILRENIFSTMMPGFQWINSSWATDLLSFASFHLFGFLGLSVLGAMVITGIFYFYTKTCKLSFWEQAIIFPLVLYLEKPFLEVSFRGQLLSLLFLGILFYLLGLFENGKKKTIFLSIPLFVIWSNFHGQFLLGVGYFVLWSVFYLGKNFLNKHHVSKSNLRGEATCLTACLLLSLAATMINPFGFGVILESYKHFNNPLQRYIIEWIPFERYSLLWWKLVFWDALIILSVLVITIRKKFLENIHYIILSLIFLILSFFVRRYTWTMLFISIPVIRFTVSALKPDLEEISGTLSTLLFILAFGYVLFVKIPGERINKMSWDRFCIDYVKCSAKSAQFLLEKKLQGKMLTFYNWGGYLIWKYPQIKPSIDGRMHLWRNQDGYSAFEEYYPLEQNWKDIDKSDYDIVYMTPNKPLFHYLLTLVQESKWGLIYQDDYAGVFIRNKTQLK